MSYNNSNVRIIEAETVEQRIERKLSYFDHLPKYIERGKYSNFDPRNNIEAIVTSPEGPTNTFVKTWYFGANVVTDLGDEYYAQQATNATPTNDFAGANDRCELRTSADTPAKGDRLGEVLGVQTSTRKALTSTYPKVDNSDTDNSGRGLKVATYRYDWLTTDFNLTGLVGGAIHAACASPSYTAGTGSPLLTHFSITSFDKTSSDTLKLYVNHSFLGS